MEITEVSKPLDWPINNREANLENIHKLVEQFRKEPNYKNKELLFAVIDATDINEINELGLVRLCDYEIALINELAFAATLMNCYSLKVYLYGHIARYARMHKMLLNMNAFLNDEEVTFEIKEYDYLCPELKMFYVCYAEYNRLKQRSLADTIIDIIKKAFISADDSIKPELCYSFNQMFYDLSFANSNLIFPYLCFGRGELLKLFELSAFLNNSSNNKITVRPLKGIIKLTLRQWVLKSRNDYAARYFYKSISVDNSLKALSNHQVWMSKTENLNDKREQKVIRGLFATKKWLNYDWAKKINIHQLKNSFVCSFSKNPPSETMQKKYGTNTFGYKSDRIANILSPITLYKDGLPMFGSVAFYDIIYSEKEAKDEINYLCNIIDLYALSNEEKTHFSEEILEYWYLSFKDKKWADEAERRYQLFIFNDNYVDSTIEDDFLKINSTLYLYPDFIISKNNEVRNKIYLRRIEKLSAVASSDYIFCEQCFQADYSGAKSGNTPYKKCPICDSDRITIRKFS